MWQQNTKVADAAVKLQEALVKTPLTEQERRIEKVWRTLNLPEPSASSLDDVNTLDDEIFEMVFSGNDDVEKYLSNVSVEDEETGRTAGSGLSSSAMDDMCSDAELSSKTRSQYRRQMELYLVRSL